MALAGSQIAVIGAPLDLGAGRRGVDMGPSAIRVANLDERLRKLGYAPNRQPGQRGVPRWEYA